MWFPSLERNILSFTPTTHPIPRLLYSICYKKTPNAFLFYDSESICAILIKILKNGYLLFRSFPPSINWTFTLAFYNRTNLHTCVMYTERVNESDHLDSTDHGRLHGSIHYSGYLKETNACLKNKSTHPLFTSLYIQIISVLRVSLVSTGWGVIKKRVENEAGWRRIYWMSRRCRFLNISLSIGCWRQKH